MPDAPIPESLSIPFSALVNLSVEYHRLFTWLESAGSSANAPARHAVRRLQDFLKTCELEVQTLDGRAFDPGLPVRVVDSIDDRSLAKGKAVIVETLTPLVLWRDRVVKSADVVIRKNGD